MSDVEVENLTKRFGDFVAVDAMNFSVAHGEIFGLLGPNGAGKSTLIRMLTTLVPPTSGTARVNGFDIVRAANDVRQSIGVIPQAMTSDLDLSAIENMSIFAKLYGIPREKRVRTIKQLLAEVDLEKWADKPVKMFSGGMRRRVAIARAIITRPELLLYDSPTGGLDPVTSNTIVELIVKQRDVYKTSSLMVTHRLQDAFTMATHQFDRDTNQLKALPHGEHSDIPMSFLILREGKVIFDGDMQALVRTQDEYIKEYIS